MESSSFHTDFVTEDMEVKVEIKEEIEPKVEMETETENSVAEMEQQFISAQDPHTNFYNENGDNFNCEEWSESNNQNPEFEMSYHGDDNIKYENNEDEGAFYFENDEESSNDDDFEEAEDPLALPDHKEEDKEHGLQKPQQQQQKQPQRQKRQKPKKEIKNKYGITKMGHFPKTLQQKMKSWRFLCLTCPAYFPSYEMLMEHEKTPHDPQLKLNYKKLMLKRKSRPRKCFLCFIWTPGENYLKNHLREHAGKAPHTCPCCPPTQPQPNNRVGKFYSFKKWLGHMNANHMDRLASEKRLPKIDLSFYCTITTCPEHFSSLSKLKEHLKQHGSGRKSLYAYKCLHPGCGKVFSKSCVLTKHNKTHHRSSKANKKNFRKLVTLAACKDPSCSLKFKTHRERDDHWEKDHKVSIICPEIGCSMEFFSQRDFDNHTRAHKLPPPETWELFCDFCCPSRLFPSETSLQEHFQIKHSLAHSCPISSPDCPPAFKCSFYRDLHMLEKHNTPENFKKYPTLSAASSVLQCNHGNCSIKFNTRSELFTHVKEEKHKKHEYICPATKCNFSTRKYVSFLLHFQAHSDHDPCNPDFQPEENPWTCPICHDSEECQSESSLKHHAVVEHKFSGFPCPFVYPENPGNPKTENDDDDDSEKKPMKCGMIFDNFNELEKHWKLYSEHFPQDPKLYLNWLKLAVPIKCSQEDCQEEFMSQSEIRAHVKSHFSSQEKIPTVSKRTRKPPPRIQKDQDNEKNKEETHEQELPGERRATRRSSRNVEYSQMMNTKKR